MPDTNADELARRQNYHLGKLMAGDSKRIDDLVGDVGIVRGRVEAVHGTVEVISRNVDKLADAMAGLVRYELKLEHQDKVAAAMELRQREADMRQDATDRRVTELERRIGPVEETRNWTVQGFRVVLGIVLAAIVGAVLVKGSP